MRHNKIWSPRANTTCVFQNAFENDTSIRIIPKQIAAVGAPKQHFVSTLDNIGIERTRWCCQAFRAQNCNRLLDFR